MHDMSRALVNYVAGPECTLASPYAVGLVNARPEDGASMAALWCVSRFTARAYLRAGADTNKVFVVRPPICDGIWRDMFKPLESVDRHGEQRQGPVVFGAMGTWQERKGFEDLIRAYFSTFTRSENTELHIRTSALEGNETIRDFEARVIKDIAKIALEFGDDNYPASKRQPKIKLLTGTGLSESGVIDWLGSIDYYVNTSYGEGLGIPHTWALAQGVPVLTSSFGAVGELAEDVHLNLKSAGFGPLLQPHPAELVRVPASMRAHSPIWGSDGKWGTNDVHLLGSRMRALRDGCVPHNAEVASLVRGLFSYEGCAEDARRAVARICRPEVVAEWKS